MFVFVGDWYFGNFYCGQFFYDDDVFDENFFVVQVECFGYDQVIYLIVIVVFFCFSCECVCCVMGLVVGLVNCLFYILLINFKLSENWVQMEVLINVLLDFVWLKNIDGVFMVCNLVFGCMFGVLFVEIVGKIDYDFCLKELVDFFCQKDNEVILFSELKVNEEWLMYVESGWLILFEMIKIVLFDVSGKLIGVFGIGCDMIDCKQVEENFYLMFRVFFNSGEVILIIDVSNCILVVNKEFIKLMGYSEVEVIG